MNSSLIWVAGGLLTASVSASLAVLDEQPRNRPAGPGRSDRQPLPRPDEQGGGGRGGFGFPGGPPQFGPSGAGGPGGFGGPPGSRPVIQLLEEFDSDQNGWLNAEERIAARAEAKTRQAGSGQRGRGGRRPGGGRGPGGGRPEGTPGPAVSPDQVQSFPDQELFDPTVLRTFFLEFENDDWEMELQDFHGTDVDVPALLTVDGKAYANAGVRFRGMSSYDMVPAGSKRSFNVSLDLADDEQRLYGYKTLNLLNCNGDASMMSTLLYSQIANQYLPAPKANHVHVVVNGESWGVYVNTQQFNKTFLKEHYPSSKGTRWKVTGSPRGDGGLRVLGDSPEDYERQYEMKSNDGEKAWNALIALCRTLQDTPDDDLIAALEPMLDIDETLWFLALDVALVNSDGYWTRASDYSLFRDSNGVFHTIPHDMNEAFHGAGPGGPGGPRFGPPPGGFGGPGGPGFGPPQGGLGGPGGPGQDGGPPRGNRGAPREGGQFGPPGDRRGAGGPDSGGPGFRGRGGRGFGGRGGGMNHGSVELDPLEGIENGRMPLRSRLLQIPELRERYLNHIRQIAEESLDPQKLLPVIESSRELISERVGLDTRKLSTTEGFNSATAIVKGEPVAGSLQEFIQQRRAFLLRTISEQPAGED